MNHEDIAVVDNKTILMHIVVLRAIIQCQLRTLLLFNKNTLYSLMRGFNIHGLALTIKTFKN